LKPPDRKFTLAHDSGFIGPTTGQLESWHHLDCFCRYKRHLVSHHRLRVAGRFDLVQLDAKSTLDFARLPARRNPPKT